MLAAQGDHPPHEAEHRGGVALLGLDVDRLVTVDRVHDHRQIETCRIGFGEAAVAVHAPLHRRADPIAVAEKDIVAHTQLVAVIDNGRSGHGEEQGVEEFHASSGVVDERSEAPPDAEVQPHPGVPGVFPVHIVPFRIGDHFKGQFVVVAQKECPLAVVRNGRSTVEDIGDWTAVFLAQGHEHPRHEREVKGHVAFVATAEIGQHVFRPLVGLGQEHPAGIVHVEMLAEDLEDFLGFRQVFVVGPFTDAEIGHGVEAQAVDPHVEPEAHDLEHRPDHLRVVVVEVGLVGEEAMPVVGLGDFVPGPVGRLAVGEDDPGFGEFGVGVAPDVVVAASGAGFCPSGRLEPGVLIRGVVDDQLGDDPDLAAVSLPDKGPEVPQAAVVWLND
ncbi:MAG: hypothetical protein ACD_75C02193G0002, partial [uncultured bacterium]